MARKQGIESQPFDLRREPPSDLPQNFDVAFCFEVAHYVPAELSQPLVRFIAGLAPTIAFTAAGPGQTGSGFINVQDQSYWMGLFSAEGASNDEGATEALRNAFVEEGVSGPWLIRNIIVFKRDRGSGGSPVT